MASYGTLLTALGAERIARHLQEGGRLGITDFAVGDGGGQEYRPSADMTALRGERWRGRVNSVEISDISPNVIVVKAVVPSDVGGFTIREAGVFDAQGDLIAVMNTPPTVKVAAGDGALTEQYVEMYLAVSSAEAIELSVDPSAILASKLDIDAHDTDPQAHPGLWQELEALEELLAEKLPDDLDVAESVSQLQTAIRQKADRSTHLDLLLPADAWEGDAEPYTLTVEAPGVREDCNGLMSIAQGASPDETVEFVEAMVRLTGQEDERVTFQAELARPEHDLPVTILIVG